MKIRYRWTGPLDEAPMLGCVLASARGRGAYLILAIDDKGGRVHPATREAHELLVLTVERISRATMHDHGAVYGIVWDRRSRR